MSAIVPFREMALTLLPEPELLKTKQLAVIRNGLLVLEVKAVGVNASGIKVGYVKALFLLLENELNLWSGFLPRRMPVEELSLAIVVVAENVAGKSGAGGSF